MNTRTSNIRAIEDTSDTSYHNGILIHPNEELIYLIETVSKIIIISERARRHFKTLEILKQLLDLGLKLNNNPLLLSNDIDISHPFYDKHRVFEEEWIKGQMRCLSNKNNDKEFDRFANNHKKEYENYKIQMRGKRKNSKLIETEIRKNLSVYLRLLKIPEDEKPEIDKLGFLWHILIGKEKLKKTKKIEIKSFKFRNVFVEDYLFHMWSRIIININDYHFIDTVAINHRKWITNTILKINNSPNKEILYYDVDDVLSIYYMWIRILSTLLEEAKEENGQPTKKFIRIFDHFIPLLYETEPQFIHTFFVTNTIGMMKYIIELNKPYLYNVYKHIQKRLYNKDDPISFLFDKNKINIYGVYIDVLNRIFPDNKVLISTIFNHIIEDIENGDIEKFTQEVELEFKYLKSFHETSSDTDIRFQLLLLILLVSIIVRNNPQNNKLRKLYNQYQDFYKEIDSNVHSVLSLLKQLKEFTYIDPDIQKIREEINKRFRM